MNVERRPQERETGAQNDGGQRVTHTVPPTCAGDCATRAEHERRFRQWQRWERRRRDAAYRSEPLDGYLAADGLVSRDPERIAS